jgi:large subunit ribosomal protein L28
MSRTCDLTGKARQSNNKVSHSNIKSRKFSQSNLKTKKIYDPETGKTIRLRVSTAALRTLDKVGSLSKFLRKNAAQFM